MIMALLGNSYTRHDRAWQMNAGQTAVCRTRTRHALRVSRPTGGRLRSRPGTDSECLETGRHVRAPGRKCAGSRSGSSRGMLTVVLEGYDVLVGQHSPHTESVAARYKVSCAASRALAARQQQCLGRAREAHR